MGNLVSAKILKQLLIGRAVVQSVDETSGYTPSSKPEHLSKRSPHLHHSGFTLIEMLVVVIIIGILGATAVPGWLGFVNQRRVTAVQDEIVRSLQEAQREARRTKLSRSVSFRTNNQSPELSFNSASNWQKLGKSIGVKPGQVILQTNFTDNVALATAQTEGKVTYDYLGGLSNTANLGTKGLIITVAVPRNGNPTQPTNSTRRCVIVRTLLGAVQTGSNQQCDF